MSDSAPAGAGDSALINDDLAPTTADQRTWTTWHIAALWVGMSVCIPTYMMASGLIAAGMSLAVAVACVALGNVIILIPMVLNAHAGTRYGIPFPVLLRAPFGVVGANVPAMMRALVACGWFGIQTAIGGNALYQLMVALFPGVSMANFVPAFVGLNTAQLVCFFLFWAINVGIILRGMESIRLLETWAAPFLLALGVALLVWAWVSAGSFSVLVSDTRTPTLVGWKAWAVGLSATAAFWGTLALNIPDFARFARSQRDQAAGQALGLPTTMTLFAFIGAAVTNATTHVFGAPVADPVALMARIGGPLLTVIAMLGLSIATLSTNLAANVVSPANDFSNLAPRRISFKAGAVITAVVGFLIMPWKLMTDLGAYLFTWLIGYGAMLGAVGGVMIADYFVIRRMVLDRDALYRRGGPYEYTGGFNLIALVALAAGISPNVPGFIAALTGAGDAGVFSDIYQWAWFVAFFTSGVVYTLGMLLLGTRPAPLPHAAVHTE